jgi:hypothetical protein
MGAAVAAAGTDRMAGLGFTSLTALSTLNAKGQFPFTAQPGVLAPLAHAVAAQGLTPASFAALSTPEKIDILARAAVPAEAQAAAVADAALAAVAEPVRIGTYKDAASKVADARAVSLYLPAARVAQVEAAQGAVLAYERKRKKLIETFLHGLPGKIAAGAFDGTNIVGRDADGWYAADESPEKRYETVNALYNARLDRIGRGALGPWTARETDLMKAALENPEIAEALEREYQEAAPGTRPRPSDLGRFLDQHRARAEKAVADDSRLTAAFSRFEKGTPRGTDIRVLEEFYNAALNRTWSELPSRAWIVASIKTGGGVLPGWEALQDLNRAAQRRYTRDALKGLAGFVAGMILIAASGVAHWPTGVQIAAFAAVVAPLAWMSVNFWRRDEFDVNAASINIHLDR